MRAIRVSGMVCSSFCINVSFPPWDTPVESSWPQWMKATASFLHVFLKLASGARGSTMSPCSTGGEQAPTSTILHFSAPNSNLCVGGRLRGRIGTALDPLVPGGATAADEKEEGEH